MRIYFFNLFQFPGVYFICCIFYRICTQIFWITLIVTRGKESRFQLSIIKLFHVPRPTLIDIYRKCTTSYSASFDADYWLNGLLLDRLLPRDNVSTMCVKARLTWSKNEGLCPRSLIFTVVPLVLKKFSWGWCIEWWLLSYILCIQNVL